MKVLDLFSGLGGFSQAFKDRGHEIFTVDIEERFNPNLCIDIMKLESSIFKIKPDIILASPCQRFSVRTIGRYWKGFMPKDNLVNHDIRLVLKTIDLIFELKPRFWVIENPMGMLRTIIGKPQYEISQCQYGREFRKPTDLWGRLPKSFKPKKCIPKISNCHIKVKRGGINGVDSLKTPEERAKIPYGLSLVICESCEKELNL